ncbi:hypothetical protein ACPTGM_22530 [Pseudomonas aeruginosa]|nr:MULTISPECIES: hypothetical protein [Pseudomonadaceae]KJS71841.1 MAG: hypothetical protein JL55_29115 [[Pseudomonas] sp. BICA1-14]MBC7198774.1 hypothetical protein [Stutzerimonas balearica]MCC0190350.1 hypothetical protein [Pseudomonas aeruginosa]
MTTQYLVEHEEGDAHLAQALQTSRYLGLWRDEFERSAWQYHVAMMEGHDAPEGYKRKYCEELIADQKLGQNRLAEPHSTRIGTLAVACPAFTDSVQLLLIRSTAILSANCTCSKLRPISLNLQRFWATKNPTFHADKKMPVK